MKYSVSGMKILVVDDDDTFRHRLSRAFRERGLIVQEAFDVDSALKVAQTFHPDLGVIDLQMPGGSGLLILKELLSEQAPLKLVVLTGYGSIATAIQAVKLGAVNYLTKPADADQILLSFFENNNEEELETNSKVLSLDRVQWEHIQRVITECNGNISKASKVLGIHRRSLQRKLSKAPWGGG